MLDAGVGGANPHGEQGVGFLAFAAARVCESGASDWTSDSEAAQPPIESSCRTVVGGLINTTYVYSNHQAGCGNHLQAVKTQGGGIKWGRSGRRRWHFRPQRNSHPISHETARRSANVFQRDLQKKKIETGWHPPRS